MATALILKDYKLNRANLILMATMFGLLTNIYHSGAKFFSFVLANSTDKEIKEIQFMLLLISYLQYFLFILLVDYSGLLFYKEHIVVNAAPSMAQ